MSRSSQNCKFPNSIVSAAVTASILAGAGIASPANAACMGTLCTLTDQNSTVNFDLGSHAGLSDWIVDGVDHVEKEWFWYRIGDDAERSIDTLQLVGDPIATDTDGDLDNDNLFARYLLPGVFELEINWGLTGAPAGTRTSDVAETIEIINISGDPLDISFFEYTDFDLTETPFDDTVMFNNIDVFMQMDNSTIAQVSAIPDASHYEAEIVPITLDKLKDGFPTTLSDTPPIGTPLGPDNVTAAWQWDFSLSSSGPSSTVIISKDKLIRPKDVPEPGTIFALLTVGSLGLGLTRKKLK